MLVDNPILNSPFEEPSHYWAYEEGQPVLKEGRRPAGYYLRPRTPKEQKTLFEEEFIPIELVNGIRQRVRAWRHHGYPGVTPITRQLLNHWNNPERERKLFFCQREAAETIIWLVESQPAGRQGIAIPKDTPNDPVSLEKHYKALTRYAIKMATGSGKTVVMGMLIAWSVLNKLTNPQDRRFSDAVLLVCPNLTIRERLHVLLPWHKSNYYDKFDLVPRSLVEKLHQGRYLITNWHLFQPQDDSRARSVVQRGPESDQAFCNRVLKELGNKQNILVINDEAHHAYRPAQPLLPEELKQLSAEERQQLEEEFRQATVWVSGLDRINAVRGINMCLDFSATPFYIKGSGHDEGTPFPWVVSDFGLVDAIECGIVKVPRVPVDDNTGDVIPRYFRLWEWINSQLPYSERQTARRRAKPESVLREAEDALATLASEWKKTFEEFQRSGSPLPPAMIVVCDNTDLAKVVHKHIASGKVLEELQNRDDCEVTIRIDTKLLEEAESTVEGETKQQAAERLRKIVDTVGKTEWEGEGEPPGKHIRCVVSVGMLNEGWDAQNVTQILGLRAFTSQLLCEQVVGRGLRRLNYDEFTEPEYVDVYGIPFEVIPVKKKPLSRRETTKVSTLVRALPERKHLEITFPRVEGYIFDVRHRVKCDVDRVPPLIVHPSLAPTEVVAKDLVGYRIGRPDRLGPGREVVQDRNPFHKTHRLQQSVYEIAARITNTLKDTRTGKDYEARRFVFPQVLNIVWEYLERRVQFVDAPPEEIALRKYTDLIVERLAAAIEPDTEAGEPSLLPVLERFRPLGSTSEVLFRTVRPCFGTTKSHVSHIVADSSRWEHSVAYILEQLPFVISYVKNDHLDFTIPYEWQGGRHEYRPDYLIRLRRADGSELKAIVEVKGFETEQDRQKEISANRWIKAINYHGGLGRWIYLVCKDPRTLARQLEEQVNT